MALRLLLDVHISPKVAATLRGSGIDAVSLREWQGGQFLSSPDDQILRAAQRDGRVLVTYDVRSIPRLTRSWQQQGAPHAGVLYVSGKTVRSNAIGRLADAVVRFVAAQGDQDWANREDFLSE